MQQRKHLPCHKICLKCLVTSYVGSVINVKICVKLQDIRPKYLNYLLKPQKMQFVLFEYSLTSVSGRTVHWLRAETSTCTECFPSYSYNWSLPVSSWHNLMRIKHDVTVTWLSAVHSNTAVSSDTRMRSRPSSKSQVYTIQTHRRHWSRTSHG